MKIFVIAKTFHPLLDFAVAFTINVPDVLNVWFILFPFLTILVFQSQKSHSMLSISQLVNGSKVTVVGNHVVILLTLIKKLYCLILLSLEENWELWLFF